MRRFFAILLFVSQFNPGRGEDPKQGTVVAVPWKPVAKPYEVLRRDAAWCAPRIVYFFAWYLGHECTLDEVVRLCNTDREGFTTLQNVVEAASQLGLHPVGIACSGQELDAVTGPAIVCVQGAPPKDQNNDPKKGKPGEARAVHFIGIICRSEKDYYWVVDPAHSTGVLVLAAAQLQNAFTGQVVLLNGSSGPPLRPGWARFPWIVVAVCVLIAGLYWIWSATQWLFAKKTGVSGGRGYGVQ